MAPLAQEAVMAERADNERETPRLAGVPTVTGAQARAAEAALADHGLDRDKVADVSAGNVHRLLASGLLEALAGKPPKEASVTVMAGTGHKGQVALGVARRLADGDVIVNVVLSRRAQDYGEAAQADIAALEDTAKKVYNGYNERAFDKADLAIDGLIGVGLEGRPKAAVSLLIKGANFSMKPIVALDVPTGIDATTGTPSVMAIKARATLALGLPKSALAASAARDHVGRVFLVDSGVPAAVWREVAGVTTDVSYGKDGARELAPDT